MLKALLSGLLALAKFIVELVSARRASGRVTEAQKAPSQAQAGLEQAENQIDAQRTAQDQAVVDIDRAGAAGSLRDQSDAINAALDRASGPLR